MKNSFLNILSLVFIGFLIIIFWLNLKKSSLPPLQINFLDIGQGDAILISDNKNNQILIDGGPDGKTLLGELGKVMPILDKKIEYVILTHPDGDHYLGLIDLLENYKVENFLFTGEKSTEPAFLELLEKLKARQISTKIILKDDEISWGSLKIKTLSPIKNDFNPENKNENSVVLLLNYGKNLFLLTGDAEILTEQKIIRENKDLHADWLKVGHHGSKHATSGAFLNKLEPKNAIISNGKNNTYGHPSEEVLDRLKKRSIKIWRTDEIGTIRIFCNLENCWQK